MSKYIVTQIHLQNQIINGNTTKNEWITVTRQVIADSTEEAIGKFIVNTSPIKAVQKLNVQCIELSTLRTI